MNTHEININAIFNKEDNFENKKHLKYFINLLPMSFKMYTDIISN